MKQMMTPQKQVSPPNLLKGQANTRLFRSAFAIASFSATLFAFGSLALAQSASGGAQAPQVQTTAARSKPATPPAAPWPARGNDPSGSPLPHVTYEDGQLTISANNSTLSDVLFALHACTGADIDIPNNASSERVTAQLGPGPARKVLSDLLGWSNFDYIIQGSDTDALSIHSVTLMVRVKNATGTSAPAPGEATSRHPMSGLVHQAPDFTEAPPAALPEPPPAAQTTSPDQPMASAPEGLALAPDPQNKLTGAGGAGAAANGASANAGKSPDEMIQELQQMYQQRRSQMIGAQSPNPGQKPPGT